MLALVEQLKGFILDGQVVYMHCWGGRGRAGTIASCFLASCYHLSAEETADRIQLAFDTRNDGGAYGCSPCNGAGGACIAVQLVVVNHALSYL